MYLFWLVSQTIGMHSNLIMLMFISCIVLSVGMTLYLSLILTLLTLGACASEGYSSWSVCVCLSVCLSGRDKPLRSLTPARYSAYRL